MNQGEGFQVDTRNRDELLKKQESLEAYLLKNPQSTLFAWYARQNMEAGELNRALSICLLGLQNVESRGVLHKLMGEIYLAKGEVTNSMKQMIECILTREPFPGVIIEVIKNLGDTMEPQQVAFLIYLLNKALPGHPDAIQFYNKFPNSRNYVVQPGEYQFLEDLALGLERSALIETMPLDEDEENPLALPDSLPPEMEYAQPEPVQQAPPQAPAPEPQAAASPIQTPPVETAPEGEYVIDPELGTKSDPPVPEYEIPITTPTLEEVIKQTDSMTGFDDIPMPEMEPVQEQAPPQQAAPAPEPIVQPIPQPPPTPVAQPAPQAPAPEPVAQPAPQAPPQEAAPSSETPPPPKKPAIKHNINRSMATFTLMQIFKDQGMYENALEVLTFLREKSTDTERIDQEEREIRELLAGNGN